MRIFVHRELGAQFASSAHQRTRHGSSLCGPVICLFDGTHDQAADRNARALRPVPQPVVERFRDIDGGPDWHDMSMSLAMFLCQS